MKKKKIDSDMPIGRVKVIRDFLPPPESLIVPEETVKVTIALRKSSIQFFKQKAKQSHTQYQKMIRELLDLYVAHYRAA